jgi:hypothetical protein
MITLQPPFNNPDLQKLRSEIELKSGHTPEELYEEREKRLRDVINLKEPDRVPLWVTPDPCRYTGLPRSAAFYDPAAWREAIKQLTLAIDPDFNLGAMGGSGLAWETLGVKNKLWPGGPLPPDYEYQFVEGEYMKEEEYDLFLSDPSDFIIRYYLPRMYGSLAPFSQLPPINQMFGAFDYMAAIFASPEFEKLGQALFKAGREQRAYQAAMGDFSEEMALLGYPELSSLGGVGGAPFDTVSSFFRGMKGAFIDMFRRPEKLLQLCDKILEQKIASARPADPQKRGNPKRVAIPLWRGDRKFMSDQQFRKFYWPGLKKALQATIDLNFIPVPGFEAHFGDRLECLLELPKGKVAAIVHYSDVVKAKEILHGHSCVIGTAPPSLKYASLQEAEDYYKNLIKTCGQGGGFMINLSFPDKVPVEGVKAILQSLKEYGRY